MTSYYPVKGYMQLAYTVAANLCNWRCSI